ncbi:hypothetical protein [Luteibacter sp. CQ10]|uniref:hypothetical protein n=1 Tax=Luteibacter sp. CQ10 TaxID=2805821 RepID=UPI0034A3C804
MLRHPLLKAPSPRPIDTAAIQRRQLAMRGTCRRHGNYAANILVRGVVIASGCQGCGQAVRR